MHFPLSILIWLPLASAAVAAIASARLGPRIAFGGALGTLALAIGYVADFLGGGGGTLHFVTDRTWIAELGIHYKLGLDGLNLFLVLLTALIFAAVILWANLRTWERS